MRHLLPGLSVGISSLSGLLCLELLMLEGRLFNINLLSLCPLYKLLGLSHLVSELLLVPVSLLAHACSGVLLWLGSVVLLAAFSQLLVSCGTLRLRLHHILLSIFTGAGLRRSRTCWVEGQLLLVTAFLVRFSRLVWFCCELIFLWRVSKLHSSLLWRC